MDGDFGELGAMPPTGVDEAEVRARPVDRHLEAVTGDARVALDDGHLAADDPVDERRLADVRPAGDDHHGKG